MAPTLKVPKGTRDFSPTETAIRQKIFSRMEAVFKRHGAGALDTPDFELKEVLTDKYGEDSKLIYDLADQGGELCSLRYDLTVPLARYLAMNPTVQSLRRYQIAKVHRRDQPAMTKGRMREFYQCDIDFVGSYDAMHPDAEILALTCEVFEELGWGDKFTIKINHRKLLDGIFSVCGVPGEKIRTISSAVDKLDKSPWEEVRREMVEDKGLDPTAADRIGVYVRKKSGSQQDLKMENGAPLPSPTQLLDALKADAALSASPTAKEALDDLSLLFTYLDIYQALPRISLDMSLARGLDYYTGVIFEVITEGSAPPSSQTQPQPQPQTNGAAKASKKKSAAAAADPDADRSTDSTIGVGSLAAGGRYDNLVRMFSGRAPLPCVGISFGVERIYSIVRSRLDAAAARASLAQPQTQNTPATAIALRSNDLQVYVMAFGAASDDFARLAAERMRLCRELWCAGIKAAYNWRNRGKLQAQFKAAEGEGVPFAVILGEAEVRAGVVRLKEMGLPAGHAEKDGVVVGRGDVVGEVRRRVEGRERDRGEGKVEGLLGELGALGIGE